MTRTMIALAILLNLLPLAGRADTEDKLRKVHKDCAKGENLGVSYDGKQIYHDVYVCKRGSGKPPVVLLHELPGLSAKTLDYALTLADEFTVYVPLLFGRLYQDSTAKGLWSYNASGEWRTVSETDHEGSRPIIRWLHGLVERISRDEEHANQLVGVIGNCLTGALPLALLKNSNIKAIVIAQPTLPFFDMRGDFGISDSEWRYAKTRLTTACESSSQGVASARAYGVRFEFDRIAWRDKHERLLKELGSGYVNAEITTDEYDIPGDDDHRPKIEISHSAHSTLIGQWMNVASHPSERRRQEVKTFLKEPCKFERENFSLNSYSNPPTFRRRENAPLHGAKPSERVGRSNGKPRLGQQDHPAALVEKKSALILLISLENRRRQLGRPREEPRHPALATG